MPLGLSRAAVIAPSARELDAFRVTFEQDHCIQVRGFMQAELLAWIRSHVRADRFVRRVHRDLVPPAVDDVMKDEALSAKLFMLLNASALFRTVEAITGCDPIGSYYPTVFRLDPDSGHGDAWHDDLDGNRLVAMSVNLGEAYEGGVLQLRDASTLRVLSEVHNDGPGDAVLFRISPALQHRVTPVTGTRARLTMTGWFLRTPKAGPDWPRRLGG
ncbi:MAG TPA: 2OG-Fe(II) oxygenase [Vicinamibacterales bacterium]|nr:2OG-Fe(II) oxygenase [Vicinamibacterales bacterium]